MSLLPEPRAKGEPTLCLSEPGVTDAGEGVKEDRLLTVWTSETPEEALLMSLSGEGVSRGVRRAVLLGADATDDTSEGLKLECRRSRGGGESIAGPYGVEPKRG